MMKLHLDAHRPASIFPSRVVLVEGVTDAVEVSGSDYGWCARRREGRVFCWGAPDWKTHATTVSNAAEISGACARTLEGKIMCWEDWKPASPISGITGATSLAKHDGGASCAVLGDKTVMCWGTNNWGQLGDGTTTDREAPVKVKGIANVDEVSASYFFGTCARSAGKVKCWGGELAKQKGPREIPKITNAVQIAVAEYHACARLADGTIACWGSNHSGQLGMPTLENDGGTYGSDVPAIVSGLRDVVEVAVGGGEPCGGCGRTCARKSDGTLLCWGDGTSKPTVLSLP